MEPFSKKTRDFTPYSQEFAKSAQETVGKAVVDYLNDLAQDPNTGAAANKFALADPKVQYFDHTKERFTVSYKILKKRGPIGSLVFPTEYKKVGTLKVVNRDDTGSCASSVKIPDLIGVNCAGDFDVPTLAVKRVAINSSIETTLTELAKGQDEIITTRAMEIYEAKRSETPKAYLQRLVKSM